MAQVLHYRWGLRLCLLTLCKINPDTALVFLFAYGEVGGGILRWVDMLHLFSDFSECRYLYFPSVLRGMSSLISDFAMLRSDAIAMMLMSAIC